MICWKIRLNNRPHIFQIIFKQGGKSSTYSIVSAFLYSNQSSKNTKNEGKEYIRDRYMNQIKKQTPFSKLQKKKGVCLG